MKAEYIAECKIIQQNCTYTAEAHHQIAQNEKRKSLWLEVVPAICAALTGALVAAKIAEERLLFLTIIAAVMSAVTAVLNPKKNYEAHLAAARDFTAMKHDARFLHEAGAARMSDEAFAVAVENLHSRYNDLLRAVPPTNAKAFAKAQQVIMAGVHEPDTDEHGKVR